MGYTTTFEGAFKLDKSLTPEHARYLREFQRTRRMKRDSVIAERQSDSIRADVGLPIGENGCYFVGGGGFMGQDEDPSVLDCNVPPKGQPGLWCQWVPTEDGTAIQWNDGEKFYNYTEWIKYLIEHFLEPWGYVANGEVEWQGDEKDDIGKIVVENNNVKTLKGRRVYG